MVRSRAATDIERATLKKATVSTAPPWAEKEPHPWKCLLEDNDDDDVRQTEQTTVSSPTSTIRSHSTKLSSTTSLQRTPNATSSRSGQSAAAPAWSIFATMNYVSTVSERLSKKHAEALLRPDILEATTSAPEPLQDAYNQKNLRRQHSPNLDEIFHLDKTEAGPPNTALATDNRRCTCACSQHQPHRRIRAGLSARSMKRHQKHSLELIRGYPSGQCVSSSEPPASTTWDEKDPDDLLLQERRQSIGTNTAINIEAVKMFLNSPLFSTILKILTIMAAVSLFAIALDAIVVLHRDLEVEDYATPLSNATASLIITVILSILTVAYSCFTIFLESRMLPEGLDTSNSKPLFVIFSEIIASVIWAQVLSVTTYIYIWTFGCTVAGERQLSRLWKQDELPSDHAHIVERMCRRQGAMVGLEVLLVLLLIFNFYTHLAQNFRFIRAVSR